MVNNVKNILKTIIFLFFVFILFVVLSYIKKPKGPDLRNITGFYGEKDNSLDMIYIGGSAAFVYWEPLTAYENYGISSYLYAANTIQVEYYKYMIKEVLKTQSPKLIVIDARAFQYRDVDQPPNSVAYRNVLSGMPFSKNKLDLINNTVPKYLNDSTNSYIFDLLLYHSSNEYPALGESLRMMIGEYDNNFKGFFFVPKALRMEQQEFSTEEVSKVSAETDEILTDLLNYLKTIDTDVLFVVSPYIEIKSEKATFNYVESKITGAGFKFVDSNEYTNEMNMNFDTDFYNENHVNVYGADKYTEFLAKFIDKTYSLPDRRKDSSYSSWNNLLDDWHYYVEDNKKQIDLIIGGKYYNDEIFIKGQ